MPRGHLAAVSCFIFVGCVDGNVAGVLALDPPDAGTTAPASSAPDAADLDASPLTPDAGISDAGFVDSGIVDSGVASDAQPPPPPAMECGDGSCNGNETCDSCPGDCGACGQDPQWAALESQVLALINERRAEGATCGGTDFGPAPPLLMDSALQRAARDHSADMAEQNYFSHTSKDGRSAFTRMLEAGYSGQPISENIAAGQSTADSVMSSWMGSTGHCSNIMSTTSNELGVGYAFSGSSQFGHYWTLTFGRR